MTVKKTLAVGKEKVTSTTTIEKKAKKSIKGNAKTVGVKRATYKGKAVASKSVESIKVKSETKKPIVASKDLKKRVVKAEAKTKSNGKAANAKQTAKNGGIYLSESDL